MLTKDHGTVRDRLIGPVSINWTQQNQMKSRKNTNKGYIRTLKYSNGLELQFHDLYSYMGTLLDMSGDTLRKISRKGFGLTETK